MLRKIFVHVMLCKYYLLFFFKEKHIIDKFINIFLSCLRDMEDRSTSEGKKIHERHEIGQDDALT